MRPPISLSLLFKIISLTIALVLVVVFMRAVNTQSIEQAFQALGIEPGTPQSPGLQPGGQPLQPNEARFNICRTRIVSIRWPDGRRIEEQNEGLKLRWMAVEPSGASRELGYLDVEKWLSAHCQIIIEPIAQDRRGEMSEYLSIGYVDGSSARISRSPEGVFSFAELGETRPALSPDLEAATVDLLKIGQF